MVLSCFSARLSLAFFNMMRMSDIQSERFDFLDESATLRNTACFDNSVQAVNYPDREHTIRGVRDIFLLHRCVKMHGISQRRFAMQVNAHLEIHLFTNNIESLSVFSGLKSYIVHSDTGSQLTSKPWSCNWPSPSFM